MSALELRLGVDVHGIKLEQYEKPENIGTMLDEAMHGVYRKIISYILAARQ